MYEAIARVNANSRQIDRPLLGKPLTVRGHFTDPDGQIRRFDVRGWLLYYNEPPQAPRFLRLKLDQLGQTVLELGSNEQEYWLWIRPEIDTYWHGRYDRLAGGSAEQMPFRPDQVIEALGLAVLPTDTRGPNGPVYRVMDEANQLLFIRYTRTEQGYISKEYWLDRRAPGLVRRIVFRSPDGRVVMEASLDDYRPVVDSGEGPGPPQSAPPLAACRISIRWPRHGAEMNLRVGRWRFRPDAGPQIFRSPRQRGLVFAREIALDQDSQ